MILTSQHPLDRFSRQRLKREQTLNASPSLTPFPCRFADTIGLVVERKRPEKSIDRLRWYCPNSEAHKEPFIIREEAFHCTDLGTQLKPLIQNWMSNEELRKCPDCGTVAPAK